jgi:hypothetical protein
MGKASNRIFLLVAVSILLLFVQSVSFVRPAWPAERLDGELRETLVRTLEREGYVGKFRNGQDLQRGLSAYLWDNRNWLHVIDFNHSRQVDVVVCLLHKKGYPGFADYLNSEIVKNWCDNIVQQP